MLEPSLLVVFSGERFHHANRREHFLQDRHDLALFTADGARSSLDAARETIDDQKEHRRNRKSDQRKLPVEIEHYADHADEREDVDDDAEQHVRDQALNGVNVARHAAD